MADEEPTFISKCNKIENCLSALKSMTVDLLGKPNSSSLDELAQMTPAISEAMLFDSKGASERELRTHNSRLQHLLGKMLTLVQQKSRLCANLEGQNKALSMQTSSLRNIVAITKDLLGARNRDVSKLQVDLESLQEKVMLEREKHSAMASRMAETRAAMDALRMHYEEQLHWWNDLRPRYEQRLTQVEEENKRLKGLMIPLGPEESSVDQGEGDVLGESLPCSNKPGK